MERWCVVSLCLVFFFNDTATTEIYTLSLHDALPISLPALQAGDADHVELVEVAGEDRQELHPLQQGEGVVLRQLEHAGVEVQPRQLAVDVPVGGGAGAGRGHGLIVPQTGCRRGGERGSRPIW